MSKMFVDIDALIIEVKNRPPLYNMSNREYHSRGVKKQLWEEVCATLRTPEVWNSMKMKHKMDFEKEVLKKWNSLRTCFRRELRVNMYQNEAGLEKKRKKYVYYDDLQFLLPFTKVHQNESLLENDQDTDWLDLSDEDITETKPSKQIDEPDENYEEPMMPLPVIKSEAHSVRHSGLSEGSDGSSSVNPIGHDFRHLNRKRKRVNRRINDSKMIREDSHLLGNRHVTISRDNHGDEAFLTSLLPSLKEFSSEEKLQLRIEILKTILNFKKSLHSINA